jgi:hypothetical protein
VPNILEMHGVEQRKIIERKMYVNNEKCMVFSLYRCVNSCLGLIMYVITPQ